MISNLPSNILLALATNNAEIARNLLIKLVKAEPANVAAWLCLAVTLPRQQSVQALRRVLLIDPANAIALRNLTRLRDNPRPDFTLQFSDLWDSQEVAEDDTVAIFGNEQPTLNLRGFKDLAEIGDEEFTMPLAFHFVMPPVQFPPPPPPPDKAYRPEPAPVVPAVKTNDVLTARPVAQPPGAGGPPPAGPAQAAQEPGKAAPPPNLEVPVTADTAKSLLKPAFQPRPVKARAASVKVFSPAAADGSTLNLPRLAFSSPLISAVEENLEGTTARPLRSGTSPAYSYNPGLNLNSSSSSMSLKPRPATMPKLQNGPRPMLGTAQRPAFGVTAFGLVLFVLLIVLVVLFFFTMAGWGS